MTTPALHYPPVSYLLRPPLHAFAAVALLALGPTLPSRDADTLRAPDPVPRPAGIFEGAGG